MELELTSRARAVCWLPEACSGSEASNCLYFFNATWQQTNTVCRASSGDNSPLRLLSNRLTVRRSSSTYLELSSTTELKSLSLCLNRCFSFSSLDSSTFWAKARVSTRAFARGARSFLSSCLRKLDFLLSQFHLVFPFCSPDSSFPVSSSECSSLSQCLLSSRRWASSESPRSSLSPLPPLQISSLSSSSWSPPRPPVRHLFCTGTFV
mmetsp:Transcript_31614/g.61682  ORF Transcript_31614/g.61682 Transcript_31614/m.61682 type:complete len:208 (+) Transcript_31614:260-883(+)